MTDLASWLLAQIADDEAAARAAHEGTALPAVWSALFALSGYSGAGTKTAMAHIARHDPARVLAECAAKRAIVDYCLDEIRISDLPSGNRTVPVERMVPEDVADEILCLMAQPYADRPGFDPAWKVEK